LPKQHIYYFKSQTENVVSNGAILTHLFIDILKGVDFEWSMKLFVGSIKKWDKLEKLILARLFEDDTKVSMPTLFVAKQKKEESINMFVERF